MLGFIAGRAGTGKTYTVLRSAVAEAAEHDMTYIIVPEQSTLSYEKQLIEYNAEARRRGVEVLSFTRMVEKVMLVTGGLAGNYIDSMGKTALIYRAICDCRDSLRLFGKYAEDPKFAVRVAETADELKINNVSPQALIDASQNGGFGGTLRDKLADTALIIREYERLISGSYFDPVDKLTALREILDGFGFFKRCAVYFDGFNGFTAQEEKIIESIILQCDRCVISLSAPSDGFGEETFFPIATMAKHFRDFAEANGVAFGGTVTLTGNRKFETESMLLLERELYSGSEKVDGGEEITIYRAADPYDEMRFVASEIRRLVAEENCRYRDFAIVAGDLEGCRSAAEIELEQYEIPYFIDSRRDVRFKPLMRLVSFSIRAATRGMFYEDVADVAKTGLAGVGFDEAALLENYVKLWRISGRKWESEFTLNPRGFTDEMKDEDRETLAKVNEARIKLSVPLNTLGRKLKEAASADEYAAAIYGYLEAAGTAGVIRAERAAAAAADEEYDGDRMWELLMDALDRISSAMGSEPISTESYAELLHMLFENADVGVIPPHVDEVIIGSEGRVRVEHIKYCFIVGATDENFPRPFGAKGVFTNADKEDMLKLDLRLIHEEELRRCEMMLSVYNALTIPSKGLSVSYSTAENALTASAPSRVVLELKEKFGKCRELDANNLKYEDVCSSPAAALEVCAALGDAPATSGEAAVCSAVRRTPELKEKLDSLRAARESDGRPLEPDAAAFLAGKTDKLSSTKTDQYVRCPYGFFCKYGLSLRPEAKAELDAREIGTFVHYVLERTIKALVSGGIDGDVEDFAKRIAGEYVETCLGGEENLPASFLRSIMTTTRLIAELVGSIRAELAASGYTPADFELKIGDEGVEPWLITSENGAMSFEGVVDRVDICERDGKRYLRVIDYKTNKSKKILSLQNIYNGVDIQMLVYLIAIWLNGGERYGAADPAGVFYFPANRVFAETADRDSVTDVEKERTLSGLALEESPVDARLTGKQKPPRYTMEQLRLLRKHIENLMREMRAQLAAGVIPKTPSKRIPSDPLKCDTCDYAAICGVDVDTVNLHMLENVPSGEVFDRLRGRYGDV